MKLIVGLGNPGKEYEKTRHNVGFEILNALRERLKFDEFKNKGKFDAFISEGMLGEDKVILAKPTTYMNLSGKSVAKIAKFYKVPSSDIWIVYDDLDFPLGTMKIRTKGSAGSHNGMKSIIELLGSSDFPRIRIGIDNRSEKEKTYGNTSNYVLGTFDKEEEEKIFKIKNKAFEAIIVGLENGINEAMNKFN